MRTLSVAVESFPIAGHFTISRGTRTEAVVVTASIGEGAHTGRGECTPYARYGESVEGVADLIRSLAFEIARGLDRSGLIARLPAGAARNAIDCALIDLEAKMSARSAAEVLGLAAPQPRLTAFTLSLAPAAEMARAAEAAAQAGRTLLKVKLGAPDGLDGERIAAVRASAPGARLIADANEGWTAGTLSGHLEACARARVELVEQPLPQADDRALEGVRPPLLLCADESAHGDIDLKTLARRYQAINLKLDKTGGLTAALDLARAARAAGLKVMVGSMLGTSLAMAPAQVLAADALFADLDGPLLLKRDRTPAVRYDGSLMHPAPRELWG